MQGGISAEDERVDRTLRRIAKARGSMDAQEAQTLRDAKRLRTWRAYGYASLVQYVEQRMGYTTRVAMERLRVANAIEDLPVIASLLDQGTLSISAAEEITRVATKETEADWVAACNDMPVREIEKKVSEHTKGDRPTDAPDPSLRRYSLHYKVRPETYALVRQVKAIVEKEAGERFDDDAFIAYLCRRVIDGGATERTRAPYQIAVTTCDECKKGWQDGGSVTVAMTPAAVELASCDAERIGRVGDGKPHRSEQDIPPSVRRDVLARDHHRCSVPGCTCHTNLDVHHTVYRVNGGTHEPKLLVTVCESHHLGAIRITGVYPNFLFERRVANDTYVPITHVGTG